MGIKQRIGGINFHRFDCPQVGLLPFWFLISHQVQ